jgi:putative intracellular protease/amidase
LHNTFPCLNFNTLKKKILGITMFLFMGLWACNQLPEKGTSTTVAGKYVCTPCGSSCDKMNFEKPGKCPHCGMALILQDSTRTTGIKKVAILIFDGVEILDFGGPAEVFASAGGAYQVYTVASKKQPIISQGFIQVIPEYTLENCPKPDIIVIPGGNMMEPLEDPAIIHWVKTTAPELDVALSVCTGAFVLAKAGLLDGKKATTFHNAIEDLRGQAKNTEVLENVRWVDNGKIITTAGISAGIDGALRVIDRSLGRKQALSTVRYMEYDHWNPENGLIVHPDSAQFQR